MASPERTLRGLELGALLLAAALALVFQLRLPGRLPREEDERAVAEVLAREAQPGDALLLYPWWTERARLYAPASLRVVGYQGSDVDPLVQHPRVWVLAQPDLPKSDLKEFERVFLPGRAPLGVPREFGNLRLALYRNGKHRPTLFSAASEVARASVYLESPDGAKVPCAFDGQAHRCPGELHVAAEWHAVEYQPRHCLWLQPPGGAKRLVVEFPNVPAGARLALEGGLIWDRGWFPAPQVTATHFGVDDARTGRTLLRVDLPPGLEGVHAAEAKPDSSEPRALKLWSQADRSELRELCVDFFSQGEESGGAP